MALIILELFFPLSSSTTVLDYFSLKICSDVFVFWRNFLSTRWNTILSSNLFIFLLVANSWKLNAEFMVGLEECMIALTFMHCCILKMTCVYFLFRQSNWLNSARFYISNDVSLIKTVFSNIYISFFKLLWFSVWPPCWFCLLVDGASNYVLQG